MKLPLSFYLRNDVLKIARELLGKYLFTFFDGEITAGIINETEAYAGITDKASHAFGDRRTRRTEIMYEEGGVAYVYLCYGIHSLFNIVTNVKDIPHAVLIRSVYPVYGKNKILHRVNKKELFENITRGPGKLSKALGIHYKHSGYKLTANKIWIEDKGLNINKNEIDITKRIGIDYAGSDANLPYRFLISSIRDNIPKETNIVE